MNPYSPCLVDANCCDPVAFSPATVSILRISSAITAVVALPFWSYGIAAYITHHFPQNMGTWAMLQAFVTLAMIPFAAVAAYIVSGLAMNLPFPVATRRLVLALCSLVPLTFVVVHYSWAHVFTNFFSLTAVSSVFIFAVPTVFGATLSASCGLYIVHCSTRASDNHAVHTKDGIRRFEN